MTLTKTADTDDWADVIPSIRQFLKEYLENLISRLIGKSTGSPFNYQITIVNSPEVNAITPPGHIIVYTGLLEAAENESELAAVLSHELAHNYAHHQARAVLQKYHMNTATNAVVKLINPQTATAQIASQLGAVTVGQGAQLAWPGLLRKLDRIDASYKK